MIRVYVDGSYDPRTGAGAYCVVIVLDTKKDWYVEDCDSAYVEEEGLNEAITIAGKLSRKLGQPAAVFSDSVSAIKLLSDYAVEQNVELKHLPGHLVSNTRTEVSDDLKAQHWCDTMASSAVRAKAKNMLDSKNRSVV